MGLLLNAAPSGAEHIRRLRGVDAGQISGPVLMGARPKPGRRLTDMTEMTAQVGRVATRSGGARAGPHADFVVLAARETNPPVEVTAGLASFAGWCSSVARLRLVVAGLRPKA